ncbi:MAG: protein translocase SEC61 complex subunit gamma [Nanoarchaeota archaeon]|nr:protein translocase SEC61 complex subunit gamma [Nanoarchaeota archaeon]
MAKLVEDLKAFVAKSKRVWLVLKKPSRKEFEMVAKVSAIGVLLLGVIGFLVSILIKVFFF